MSLIPDQHSILWGNDDPCGTRILWDAGTAQATVWGNLGPMPVDGATRESCELLAAEWHLEVLDHEPATTNTNERSNILHHH